MTGEYPHLHHRMVFADAGYDGVIERGMTICVESYIGEEGGGEGVKLEEQCLVTDRGSSLCRASRSRTVCSSGRPARHPR
jgi:Xaa-Pro dipeptidase